MILPFLEWVMTPIMDPQGASIIGASLLFFRPGMNFSGPNINTRVVAAKYTIKFSLMLSKNKNLKTILELSPARNLQDDTRTT